MARGSVYGEAVVLATRRRRLTDAERARIRRKWMRTLKDAGCPAEEIGDIFRVGRQWVYKELKALEEDDGGHRRSA